MEHDPYPSFRFYVKVGDDTQAVFTEMSGLQIETEVSEYAEGGWNDWVHRLPGRTKVGNITLKRGITRSNDLCAWYLKLLQRQETPQHVTISMYDSVGEPVLEWHLDYAYPVKWVGPQFVADGNAAAVETLELAHRGIRIE